MSASHFAIETPRLRIRPWHSADLPVFRGLVTDPKVMRYIGQGVAWTEETIDGFMARQREHLERVGFCLGAIEVRGDSRVVGLAGLQPLGTTSDVEIGWWLTPAAWGNGYATEAGRGSAEFAFEKGALSSVVAITHPENLRSQAVMRRLGMTFERAATGRDLGLRVPDVPIVLYRLSP